MTDATRIQTKLALEAAKKLGIAPPDPARRFGSYLTHQDDEGKGRYQLKRRLRSELPSISVALANLEATVRNEQREEVMVKVSELEMSDFSGYVGAQCGLLPISQRALTQLGQLLPYGPSHAGQYWGSIIPRRRAREFRETIEEHRFDSNAYNKELVLRIRKPEGHDRQIYAAVSPRYHKCDPDQICGYLREAIEGTALSEGKGSYTYRGTESSISLHLSSGAGIGHAALRIESSDDTRSSVKVYVDIVLPSGALIRGTQPLGRVRHRRVWAGVSLAASLRAALDRAAGALEPLARRWRDRSKVAVGNMRQAIEILCGVPQHANDKRKGWSQLRSKQVKPAEMAERIFGCWEKLQEMPPTLEASQAGLAWAVAEAAQRYSWPVETLPEALEDAAGAILEMGPDSFLRAVGQLQDRDQSINPENQELADEILDLQRSSNATFQQAQAAQAVGNEEKAQSLRERAELLAIKQDVVAERGGR